MSGPTLPRGGPVYLSDLKDGDQFTVRGGSTYFELVTHGEGSSAVREIDHGEQIDFTRGDGTPVEFEARRRRVEYWSAATQVVPK